MIESNYRRALVLSNGDLSTFVRNPISAALLATALVVLAGQLMRQAKSRANAR
jgi:putative tricarboxylic transport membrane protein